MILLKKTFNSEVQQMGSENENLRQQPRLKEIHELGLTRVGDPLVRSVGPVRDSASRSGAAKRVARTSLTNRGLPPSFLALASLSLQSSVAVYPFLAPPGLIILPCHPRRASDAFAAESAAPASLPRASIGTGQFPESLIATEKPSEEHVASPNWRRLRGAEDSEGAESLPLFLRRRARADRQTRTHAHAREREGWGGGEARG